MPSPHLVIGSRVLVKLFDEEDAALGTIVDGPRWKAGTLIFKIRFQDYENWYPAMHLSPFLRVMGKTDE